MYNEYKSWRVDPIFIKSKKSKKMFIPIILEYHIIDNFLIIFKTKELNKTKFKKFNDYKVLKEFWKRKL